MTKFSSLTSIFVTLTLIVVTILWYLRTEDLKQELQKQRRVVSYYEHLMQSESGFSTKYGSYKIVTFDGGKTWLHLQQIVKNDNLEGYEFMGVAPPEMVKDILGTAALFKRFNEKGTLNTNDPIDVQLLENVGIKVQKVN